MAMRMNSPDGIAMKTISSKKRVKSKGRRHEGTIGPKEASASNEHSDEGVDMLLLCFDGEAKIEDTMCSKDQVQVSKCVLLAWQKEEAPVERRDMHLSKSVQEKAMSVVPGRDEG